MIIIKRNNLYCVKSIMTILITIALVILTFLYPDIYEETFKSSVTMIVTFYFSHQIEKRGKNDE